MKLLFFKLQNSHDIILKAFCLLFCASLIIYALPKEGKFKYEYQQGKPWLHENLYAPFDIAILKSDEQLTIEKEEIVQNSPLYFEQNDSIKSSAIKAFENIAKDIKKLDKKWINKKIDLLNNCYKKGIVQTYDLPKSTTDRGFVIVKKNGHFEEIEYNTLLSINDVLAILNKDLPKQKKLQSSLNTILINSVKHNMFFDQKKTLEVKKQKLKDIIETHGKIEKSELIVAKGELVSDVVFWKINSLKEEYEHTKGNNNSTYFILIGKTILVFLIFFVLTLFLGTFRQQILNSNNRVIFIIIIFTGVVLMGTLPLYFDNLNVYLLPFCILPIVVKAFYDETLAAFIHILAMILIGFSLPNGYEFVYIETLAGLVATFSLVNLKKRSQLLGVSLIIFTVYFFAHLSLVIMQEGSWHNIELGNVYSFSGAAILTLLSYPLIYVFEKIFGFLSDVTLMELSDTNTPLLRDLASKAPGTFQHSMQVANLAETLIQNIGGNSLLVRTGALYHDIGKLDKPQFFIENQVSGHNPHNEIDAIESGEIIIDHVVKGIELAKKHNLPEILIDFIRTHHGTSKVKYFYFKAKEINPEIDGEIFSYPGPIPFSKETAVLMMADSCEAASRSLSVYTTESVNNLVDTIIDGQSSDGQFENADITFKDISTIKKVLKKMLLNIYHVRVEYPKG